MKLRKNYLFFNKELVKKRKSNELVTDPKARGTYNYGNNKLTHAVKDVIPWLLLGTGKDDPSNIGERFLDKTIYYLKRFALKMTHAPKKMLQNGR
ncbi:MAG: hypothetical protein K6E54_07160 [Bacteroidaceae bacterium]|nr:hypothetical protein [Bacteroidaceae bacterium]